MVLHWIFSGSKSPQISRILLSILAVLNNAVVWMVSVSPSLSKSSSPFNNSLVTVSNALITIGIIVIFIFLSFFNSLARSKNLSIFLISFSFILWSAGRAKSTISFVLFFLLLLWVFWLSFTGFYETASLLKSQWIFSVFRPISIMQRLDGFHSPSYFLVIQSLYQSFGDCTKSTNYNWYNRHFHVPQFLEFPNKIEVFIVLFTLFQYPCVWGWRIHRLHLFRGVTPQRACWYETK